MQKWLVSHTKESVNSKKTGVLDATPPDIRGEKLCGETLKIMRGCMKLMRMQWYAV